MHSFTLTLHVLGAGVVIASVIIAVVAGMSRTPSKGNLRLYKRAGTLGLYGAFWQLITGLHLLSDQVEALSKNPIFWTKMVLFLSSAFIAYVVIRKKVVQAETQRFRACRCGHSCC